jgi:hypothetical protein
MTCTTPGPDELPARIPEPSGWQRAGGRVSQLRPGDLGWFQRFGAPWPPYGGGSPLASPSPLRSDCWTSRTACGSRSPEALADRALADEVARALAEVLAGGKAFVDPPDGQAGGTGRGRSGTMAR